MSGRVEELAAEAHRLVAAGDLAAAERTLADALSGADPDPAAASPAVADAAGLRARVLVGLRETGAARGWAAYAHTASRRLHGPDDARTVRAAALLAAILHRAGSHARAARHYREVVGRLSTAEGDAGEHTLAARADLATVLHARGECTEARTLLARAWQDHRKAYGVGHPAGIKMLARLGAMARDCGDVDTARRLLGHAGTLSRAHLPPGHPMAAQVDALAVAPAAVGHACRERAIAAPPVTPTLPAPPEATEPTVGHQPEARDARGGRADQDARPSTPRALPRIDGSRLIRRRRPRTLTVAVATLAALAVGTGVALAARWGSEVPAASGGGPASAGATPTPGGSPTPGPTPTASPSATATAPRPPTGLTLRDGRDQVVLAWRYPAGADGPVLVSGGRKGQPRRAFQTLDPGASRYTVYGLADRSDYCFSVAVVYSTDTALSSAPVCTERGAARSR
jgi:hypothetical protein